MNKLRTKIKAWGGKWLNRAGKLTLIKAVISSLSVFQASFLLALKSIMDQFSKLIKDFLWQGGKGNHRKFHLVKWDKVKLPLTDGGLQIRDPRLTKLSLGGKILWKLHTDSKHPVSKILRFKYMRGESLCSLQEINVQNRSVTWNLCRKSHDFFKSRLYRISGRGNKTLLWKDSIMGNPPLDIV